jgi:cytochrome c biogenesis protein
LWTGLEVVKDPGIPFVWSGFALFCLGMIFNFTMSYQRFWIVVKNESGGVRLEIIGASRRGRGALSNKISEIKGELAKKLEDG